MKIEISGIQDSQVRNAAAFVIGGYSMYLILSYPKRFASPYRYLAAFLPVSALTISGAWASITGGNFYDRSSIIPSLMIIAGYPAASFYFNGLDETRVRHKPLDRYDSSEDLLSLLKPIAATVSSVAAVATVTSASGAPNSTMGIASLAASATFPAALSFFNFRARIQEKESTLLGRSLAVSAVIAGAASLVFYSRSALRM
jgi:hypothetical protein